MAEGTDLPRVHEVAQGAERLVDVAGGIGTVDLVEVDPVGLQPPQAGLHLLHDPAAGVPAPVGTVAHREMDLGGDDDAVAAAARQRPAHDLLGLTAGVRVGGVDEVDAGVEGPVDDPGRLLMVGVAPAAEHHGAEAQGAHLDAGAAEGTHLHGGHLLGRADTSHRNDPVCFLGGVTDRHGGPRPPKAV